MPMIALSALNDGSSTIVKLFVMLAFGGLCAALAVGRGRSGVAWFFLGVLFSCIALVVLLVIPDLKVEEERRLRQSTENRRLREQIAKNRQIADGRHAAIERRLGAHDAALNLDTTADRQLAQDGDAPPLPGGPSWFYARENKRHGPVPPETIAHLYQAGVLDRATLLWRDGMVNWTPLEHVPEFREAAS